MLVTILILGLFSVSSAQVIEGDVNLLTQAEVNAFVGTSITGNLRIQGADIVDLTPLSTLVSVGEVMWIWGPNDTLSNLDGLSSLASVGSDLYVAANDVLSNLDGLTSLSSVGGSLYVIGNAALTNLDGLSNLSSYDNYMAIYQNSSLTNLDGLMNITTIDGGLVLNNNNALTNLNGLSSLSSVGSELAINDNPALGDYCGLNPLLSAGGLEESAIYDVSGNLVNPTQQQIIEDGPCPLVIEGDVVLSTQAEVNIFAGTSITGNLTIQGSDIIDLTPLSPLTSVGGGLMVRSNSSLTNLDGLNNITSVGNLEVRENHALTNLDELSNLISVVDYLDISDNDALTNLDGLSNLASVGYYLYVGHNDALTNLDGLGTLGTVGGFLNVELNTSLTNLDGLSNIASVGGFLYVKSNPALTNLDGLSNITSVGGELRVEDNAGLNIFCGLYPLLSSNGLQGSYSVGSNLVNPTQQQIIDDGPCGTTAILGAELIPNRYSLQQNHPNPFNPTTNIKYALPEQTLVKLTVFDIRGHEVAMIKDETTPPGNYEVQWHGLNHLGDQVSTGVYFARLQAGDFSKTIKMLYLK